MNIALNPGAMDMKLKTLAAPTDEKILTCYIFVDK